MRCYVVSKHVIKSFQKSKKYKIRGWLPTDLNILTYSVAINKRGFWQCLPLRDTRFFRKVKNEMSNLDMWRLSKHKTTKTTTGDEFEWVFSCSSHLLHELRSHSWKCNLQVHNLGSWKSTVSENLVLHVSRLTLSWMLLLQERATLIPLYYLLFKSIADCETWKPISKLVSRSHSFVLRR